MFPSPIGELHFSILDIRETERVEYTVSVPYRGATFLNILCKYVKNKDYRVSVPYRGDTFLNTEKIFTDGSEIVSVPYRGATFLNRLASILYKYTPAFPSPIGELHFSIPSPQPHVLSGTNRGIAGEK